MAAAALDPAAGIADLQRSVRLVRLFDDAAGAAHTSTAAGRRAIGGTAAACRADPAHTTQDRDAAQTGPDKT